MDEPRPWSDMQALASNPRMGQPYAGYLDAHAQHSRHRAFRAASNIALALPVPPERAVGWWTF